MLGWMGSVLHRGWLDFDVTKPGSPKLSVGIMGGRFKVRNEISRDAKASPAV